MPKNKVIVDTDPVSEINYIEIKHDLSQPVTRAVTMSSHFYLHLHQIQMMLRLH